MRRATAILGLLLLGCAAPDRRTESGGEWTRTNADVHVGLARAALERRQWAHAEENAREALRVDATRADAAMLLARAQLGRGETEAAEEAAQRAIALDDGSAEAHLLRAECLLALDQRTDARAAYAAAGERGSAAAGRVLGSMLFEDGEEERAAVVLRAADALDGGVGGRTLLAALLRERGRVVDAERVLVEAAAERPDDPGLRLALDQLRFERADLGSVVERVRGADRAGRPAPLEDRLLAAAGLLRSGEGAEAAVSYRRLARQLPDEPHVRLALGEALLLEHDAEGAEAAFLAATRLDPASRAAWVGVARARRAAGPPGAAIEPLERAVALDPGHAPTRSLLVKALVDHGDLPRARAEAAEVRILDPGGRLDRACRDLIEREGADPERENGDSLP